MHDGQISPTLIAHLEHLLQCPLTGQDVHWMTDAEIAQFNQQSGETVLEAGVMTTDHQIAYRITNGIVLMLPELALTADELNVDRSGGYSEQVREFYDSFGWEKDANNVYKDTARHVDTRPVVQDYLHRCLQRVQHVLPEQGTYLLDVASGPVAFTQQQQYSARYDVRICVDLTVPALVEARHNLKDQQALFVLGDITNLPIKNDMIDAVLSMHTIYHVPADKQKTAFEELYRVMAVGGRTAVVYSWGTAALLTRLTVGPMQFVYRVIKKWRGNRASGPSLYFHAHPYRWFQQETWPFAFEIRSWRSLSSNVLKVYVHRWLFGNGLLRAMFWLEARFPNLMGRIGQYPLITFTKDHAGNN